jgi:tRNA1Val (adenine37-N6)-methyltransferase
MPNPWFRFRQFTIRQDRCAMKVGTDGVLLGAWTNCANASRILDIGTGTGVLALIAAQRGPTAMIDGVEIDAASAEQARENAAASPWPDRINMYHADVRCWDHDGPYDLVLCNPPFYKGHQVSNDGRIAVAKHGTSLDLVALVQVVDNCCTGDGRVCMILPVDRLDELLILAAAHGLHLSRKCLVYYLSGKAPKRALVEFSRQFGGPEEHSELIIEQTPGEFSPEYRALLRDLELHF